MAEIIRQCDNCKHTLTDEESFPCNICIRNCVDKWEPIPKQTNADRIRTMTDEELADAMLAINEIGEAVPFCGNSTRCNEILEAGELIPEGMCKQCLIAWLQSEVEVKNNGIDESKISES